MEADLICSFQHKGLRLFYETGSLQGIQAKHAGRLKRILMLLDVAKRPRDLQIDSFRLHRLKGAESETWSIWVSGNWRVTFRFHESDVELVNYVDYH